LISFDFVLETETAPSTTVNTNNPITDIEMTIKSKVVSISVIGLLVLAVILGAVSVSSTKSKLIKESYHFLTSVNKSKAEQIKDFFDCVKNDIEIMAKSKDIKSLNKDLIYVHKQLKVRGDMGYPVDNPLTKEKTAIYEEFFQNYAKKYGYYDIFLACAKHGHVMYTQAKESDYGANIGSGPLKNSGLGEVWKKVLQLKRTVIVDMKPYAPSAGAPAMFVGTPVYIDGKFRSVLIFQISDKKINDIMQFRQGYGDTQEDYLVGPDKLMRSDSYLDPKGHSLKASFANNTKVDTTASQEALAGKTDTKIIIDYNGNPVLSSYSPLKLEDDITWAIISEIDEAEVLIAPNALRNNLAMIVVVLLVVLALIVYFIIIKEVI
jgi:methyl-accepting chemotaxis protein